MSEPPALLAPLHPTRSVVAPADGARYTEVAGVAVLCLVDDRSVHELTPAGAVAWGLLDGRRTLADVRTGLGLTDLEVPFDAAIELLRRLRAEGLVRDVDTEEARPAAKPGPAIDHLRVAALITVEPGPGSPSSGPTLVLDAGEVAPQPTDPRLVELRASPDGAVADGQLLVGLRCGPAGDPAPNTSTAVLRRLVLATVEDDLRAPGALDLLATLAEQLTATGRSSD